MDPQSLMMVTIIEEVILPPSSPPSFVLIPLAHNSVTTSSSQVPPPPSLFFTDIQCDLILTLRRVTLRRDNDKKKLRQEVMEKKLLWLLESGVTNPGQRHGQEELLQDVMDPKWPNSSMHAFPSSYQRK